MLAITVKATYSILIFSNFLYSACYSQRLRQLKTNINPIITKKQRWDSPSTKYTSNEINEKMFNFLTMNRWCELLNPKEAS